MLDYQLIELFRPLIQKGLKEKFNLDDVDVLMDYQITKQGKSNKAVYFYILNDLNIGEMERTTYFDNDLQKLVTKEMQVKETKFQINTILKEEVDELDITAKDLCTFVNLIVQSQEFINTLQANKVGVLWVKEIRNTPLLDSDDNYIFNPSFDMAISHSVEIIGETPKIEFLNNKIYRI